MAQNWRVIGNSRWRSTSIANFEQASKAVDIDNNGNATLKFMRELYRLSRWRGSPPCYHDATFLINYTLRPA